MNKDFDALTVLTTSIAYSTLGGVSTSFPNLPICVPTTLIPLRGRFHCVPEVLKTIVRRGVRPTMLKYIDIHIEGKSQK